MSVSVPRSEWSPEMRDLLDEPVQDALFGDPLWTDRWNVGDNVRNVVNPVCVGTVLAIDPGRTIRIEWADHPHWGTYTTSYGFDHLIEPLTSERLLPRSDAAAGPDLPPDGSAQDAAPAAAPSVHESAPVAGCTAPGQ